MRSIKKDSTDQSVVIRIIDSTDGTPENSVEYNTAGIDLWYRREGATKTSIVEVALAALDSAHLDGGIELIGDGYYRLDPPDAAFTTGANGVMIGGTVTGMIVIGTYISLVDYDPQDAVRLGLTALPAAAANAAGGLPLSDAGGLDIDSKLANTNEITAARMGALTDWLNGERLDLLLDLILEDTTELQGNQAAWATATGFNTTTPPTVIQIRQEMDANSTKMAPSQTLNDYKATGFSTHNAAAVWSVGTRALTDKAGFALSTAGIKAIWDQLTSALTTAGSIGKLLVDRIDATISSRNSTTPPTVGAIRTEMEGAGTKLTEILTDTSTTLNDMIERILGMNQENFFIDNTTYSGGNMTGARVRIYSVAGSVGTASDVIATYTITATYAGSEMTDYKVVKS